jgi:hypothetical protein
MDWRNRIGLYRAYFLGLSGIGFTLPYLPLYLRQQGMSDRTNCRPKGASFGRFLLPLGFGFLQGNARFQGGSLGFEKVDG